jgi:phosphoribosylglycinamide formyltransferase-1
MKNIILFASGKGSNVAAILEYIHTEKLSISVALIVCNNPLAGVLAIAETHNIPTLLIDRASFKSEACVETLQSYNPDLLVLAGFLWKIPNPIVSAFDKKIVNIHPALLPKFGGKGMYGMHVHEAVIEHREKESGITIHYVNEHYDEGATILQAHCTVTEIDTPETVAHKIHKLEHYFFPRTIAYLLQ